MRSMLRIGSLAIVLAATAVQAQTDLPPGTWPIAKAPAQWRPAIARADLVVVSLHDALRRELTHALAQGGPAFAIKACLDRGELVGILADRIPADAHEDPIWIDFLGRRFPFPRSPFQLACLLGCPTLVSLCVRTGPARYFARVVQLDAGRRWPRAERAKGAEELAHAFARELEVTALRHPYQWFNFFDPPGRGAA